MKIQPGTKVNQSQCSTCPFLRTGLQLDPDKMVEIYSYLSEGQNHFCHSDETNHTVCRGGRDYQLNLWYRLGIIAAPTDQALSEAMAQRGLAVGSHI